MGCNSIKKITVEKRRMIGNTILIKEIKDAQN